MVHTVELGQAVEHDRVDLEYEAHLAAVEIT